MQLHAVFLAAAAIGAAEAVTSKNREPEASRYGLATRSDWTGRTRGRLRTEPRPADHPRQHVDPPQDRCAEREEDHDLGDHTDT